MKLMLQIDGHRMIKYNTQKGISIKIREYKFKWIFILSNEKSNDDCDNKTNNSINVGFRETTTNDVEMKVYFRKYRMQILIPSFTMMIFLAFAFFISSMIVLSIIPLYLGDISVAKTSFIQTSRIDLFDYEQKIFRSSCSN